MRERTTSKISNVFIEMIILVLFFSIAAVIIFRVHAITITTNNENTIKNNAIINSNSIISLYKNGSSAKEAIKKVLPAKTKVEHYDNKYVVSLNRDFTKNKENFVTIVCTENKEKTEAGIVKSIELKYLYFDTQVYKVEGKRYEEK
ncbi:MAG: hypothetical protein E7262_06565 [Lachnospiraceae bacterium]|nr:hypothetical protein [Lachnospiraceae bacterium]